jgi:hypothetical protein
MIMKAITLWQPWASLVAKKYKKIETRSWYTSYRGPIAIHAAKTYPSWVKCIFKWVADLLGEEKYEESFWYYLENKIGPFGMVVATANLVDCLQIKEIHGRIWAVNLNGSSIHIQGNELEFGDYTPGRYAWILEDIQELPEPIPARGAQGLWNWENVV